MVGGAAAPVPWVQLHVFLKELLDCHAVEQVG